MSRYRDKWYGGKSDLELYPPLPRYTSGTPDATSAVEEKVVPSPAPTPSPIYTPESVTPKTKDLICRICAVENGVKRHATWYGIGRCHHCNEQHVLYEVKHD